MTEHDRKPRSPLDNLLGDSSEPPTCKVIADDVSVHWYPAAARPGDSCMCGKTAKRAD